VQRGPRLSAATAIIAALALGTAAAGSARPAKSGTFPCHSNWSLNQGEPPGQVVAGLGVNCTDVRRAESLTVVGRLLELDADTGKWGVVQKRTAHWADLSKPRSMDLRRPCAAAFFKASFTAVLRYPDGSVAGRVAIDSGRLRVVVPCVFG
jgi:hypothetical protein